MFQSVRKFSVGMVMLALAAGSAQAQGVADLEAVHQAANQRTLVMSVARAHIQLATNEGATEAKGALLNSIRQYEEGLKVLETHATDATLNARLQVLKQQWQSYKDIALGKPGAASSEALLEHSDDLLFQADALMWQWQLRLPGEQGLSSELAFQQSMLSERIGLLQAARDYGMDDQGIQQEIEASVAAYESGLRTLKMVVQGSPEAAAVASMQQRWNAVKQKMQTTETGSPAVLAALESLHNQSNQLGDHFHKGDQAAQGRSVQQMGLAAQIELD